MSADSIPHDSPGGSGGIPHIPVLDANPFAIKRGFDDGLLM